MKTLWIILACVAVAGIVLFVVGVSLGGLKDNTAVKKVETIDDPFDRIEINEYTADLHIAPAKDGKCRLEFTQSDYFHAEVKVEDGQLRIIRSDDRPWYLKVSFLAAVNYGESTLYLPEKEYAEWTIKTVTGDLTVEGGFAVNVFRADVTTGDIQISDLTASSLFRADTTTGSIRVDGLRAGEASFDVTTGDVRLDDVVVERSLRIDSTTGDLVLRGCDAGTLIALETTTGDVTASLLSPKHFSVDSTTGDVDVPASVTGAGECTVEVTTGDVTITIEAQ